MTHTSSQARATVIHLSNPVTRRRLLVRHIDRLIEDHRRAGEQAVVDELVRTATRILPLDRLESFASTALVAGADGASVASVPGVA